MSETVRIAISAEVAPFVRVGTPLADRLHAAAGVGSLAPQDQVMLLFCLTKDQDPAVAQQARHSLTILPDEVYSCLRGWNELHPAVLHTIAQLCGNRPAVCQLLLSLRGLSEATRHLLLQVMPPQVPDEIADAPELKPEAADQGDVTDSLGESFSEELLSSDNVCVAELDESGEEIDEEGEEYLSKYKLVQVMGTGEKIKMALTGDKEWRKILIKDSNKLVSSGVLKNPRITEPEVLTVLKSGAQNDEIMRLICANKEWTKNYQIRKALIENPKTPLANALRYLSSMNEKDIAGYAKSRNISSVIATQAKRILLNKKKQ